MSGADIYRFPAQREPKPEPRSLPGWLAIHSIRTDGDKYRVELSGATLVPILSCVVTLDLASSLRVGMRVKLVLEEDL